MWETRRCNRSFILRFSVVFVKDYQGQMRLSISVRRGEPLSKEVGGYGNFMNERESLFRREKRGMEESGISITPLRFNFHELHILPVRL